MEEQLNKLTNKMVRSYNKYKTEDWNWFEPVLTFDNAIFPLALLHVIEFLNVGDLKKVAFDSMKFISDLLMSKECLSLIGNKSWIKKGGRRSQFDQQPVDAMAMVLMYKKAYEITEHKRFYNLMLISFLWFLGKNDLNVSLYDPNTKACYDGLMENGVNRNLGAESTLALLISQMAVEEIQKQHQLEYVKPTEVILQKLTNNI